MKVCALTPAALQAMVGRSPVRDQHAEFQATLAYRERLSQNKTTKPKIVNCICLVSVQMNASPRCPEDQFLADSVSYMNTSQRTLSGHPVA